MLKVVEYVARKAFGDVAGMLNDVKFIRDTLISAYDLPLKSDPMKLAEDHFLDVLKILMAAKADFTQTDTKGNSLLHSAVKYQFYEAIPHLLMAGVELELRNDAGRTARDISSRQNREREFDIYLAKSE